jgi:hypothetical protein
VRLGLESLTLFPQVGLLLFELGAQLAVGLRPRLCPDSQVSTSNPLDSRALA